MPHMFVNRPRLHDLFSEDPNLRDQFRWETINAVVYKFGGAIFVAGSVLFFPSMSEYANLGAWVFIVGSFLYLLVTGHDMAEVVRHLRTRTVARTIWDRLEFWAALSYLVGTLLYLLGSIFFLSWVELFIDGAWLFIFGSLLFVAGATINVSQIVQERELLTMQLMNLTAITYIVGSMLFTAASIPYLWHLNDHADTEIVNSFAAWQYVTGSALFLLGGVFNYWRAYIVISRGLPKGGPGQ